MTQTCWSSGKELLKSEESWACFLPGVYFISLALNFLTYKRKRCWQSCLCKSPCMWLCVYLLPLPWTGEVLQAGCRELCRVHIHKWFVCYLQYERKNRRKYCLPFILNLAVKGLCEAIAQCNASLGCVCVCVCAVLKKLLKQPA